MIRCSTADQLHPDLHEGIEVSVKFIRAFSLPRTWDIVEHAGLEAVGNILDKKGCYPHGVILIYCSDLMEGLGEPHRHPK